ncbi:MAG: hypothetical protein WBO04_10835 [Steroidobacteraceae bacterium]
MTRVPEASITSMLSFSIGSAPRSGDIAASAARRQWPAAKVGSSAMASLIVARGSTKYEEVSSRARS